MYNSQDPIEKFVSFKKFESLFTIIGRDIFMPKTR